MKQTKILTAAALAAICVGALGASASAGAAGAHASRVAKLELRHTSLGNILVNSSGFTVYRFSKDGRNHDVCVQIKECTGTWPLLSTGGRPIAGRGVKASLLSTITLSGGKKQVTYAGHPLYLYAPSEEHAETAYVGAVQFGGTWYAVNSVGNDVR